MYETYEESIYNKFIKDLRKNKNLSLNELSKILPFSSGTLSLFENSPNILSNEKTNEILSFYNLDSQTLIEFDSHVSNLFSEFVKSIVFIDKVNASKIKTMLFEYLTPYKDTVLYSLFHLVDFIDKTHNDKDVHTIPCEPLINCIQYLTPKYKSLAYMYLATNHVKRKEFDKAKDYFDSASFFLAKDDEYVDMYYYFLASYYIFQENIINSISACENAILLFTKSQNIQRLSSTNIIVANQYLKLKDYKKALKINYEVYRQAVINNDLFDQRASLNNIGFIHTMQSNFLDAEQYYSKIPLDYMKESHYYAYMICLAENENYDIGLSVCNMGADTSVTPYYKYFFKIYSSYFHDQNLKKLARNIEKAFEEFDDYLDIFEREFLCVLLANQYKRLGNIKKALDYYEKLHELNYSS